MILILRGDHLYLCNEHIMWLVQDHLDECKEVDRRLLNGETVGSTPATDRLGAFLDTQHSVDLPIFGEFSALVRMTTEW